MFLVDYISKDEKLRLLLGVIQGSASKKGFQDNYLISKNNSWDLMISHLISRMC